MSPANFLVLQAELRTDPLGRGYAGMSDAAAAADLNTKYRSALRDVGAVQQYTLNTAHNPAGTRVTASIWLLTEDVANKVDTLDGVATEQQQDAARFFLKILNKNPLDVWDFTDANLDVTLSRLVGASVMSETDRANIKALSENQATRGEELGIGSVSEGEVAEARA